MPPIPVGLILQSTLLNWFPRYFPGPIPYSASPIDIREWKIDIVPPSFSPPVQFRSNTLKVSLHRILVEAGIALTPPTSSFDPRVLFALYKYSGDFTGTAPLLRFYSGAANRDPRQTAIASEEVSTGITCYILREHFKLDHIADAYAVIQGGGLEYVDPDSEKRPDYFCQDSSGEVVIAESKGATGTRSSVTGRIDPEGWDQVQNVRPVNHPFRANCGRVVIGTHFCIEGMHRRSETTTIIKDPPGEKSYIRNPESDNPIRLAYAKALRFSGQDNLAERLILALPIMSPLQPSYEDIKGQYVWIFGSTPFGNPIGIVKNVAEVLLKSGKESMIRNLAGALEGFREQRKILEDVGYALPNGIVILTA